MLPQTGGEIQQADEAGFIEAREKLSRKTLACGEKTLITEFLLEKGAALPAHGQPERE